MSTPDDLLRRVARLEPQDPTTCTCEPEFDAGRLVAWRDGQSTGPEAAEVVAHLAVCAACRAFLAAFEPTEARPPGQLEVTDDDAPVAPMSPTAPTPPKVTKRLWIPAVMALAAAAVVVLAVQPWRSPSPVEAPPLPDYVAGPLEGGEVTLRSPGEPPSKSFLPHSRVEWVVRPASAVDPPVHAALYRVEGERWQRLPDDAFRVTREGAVKVDALAERLFGRQFGEIRLVVAIARDDDALEARPPGGRVFEAALVYRDESP